MRTNGKQFLLLAAVSALLLAPVVSSHAELKKKADDRNLIEKSSDAVSNAVDTSKRAVKRGVQKTGDVTNDARYHVKSGLRRAGSATADAAEKVKDTFARSFDTVKDKVKETTQ